MWILISWTLANSTSVDTNQARQATYANFSETWPFRFSLSLPASRQHLPSLFCIVSLLHFKQSMWYFEDRNNHAPILAYQCTFFILLQIDWKKRVLLVYDFSLWKLGSIFSMILSVAGGTMSHITFLVALSRNLMVLCNICHCIPRVK